MTRTEKLKKLGNAIKRLRGLKSLTTGKWHTPPNPAAVDDVLRWLQKLAPLDALPAVISREQYQTWLKTKLTEIVAFRTVGEYEAWMKRLEAELA